MLQSQRVYNSRMTLAGQELFKGTYKTSIEPETCCMEGKLIKDIY